MAPRRQMEAVAAQPRALPRGGEVPEDYRFDCIGADGAPETVRMSGPFRGGDTLMLYHYVFPRHSGDTRPGPARGAMAQVPLEEGPCPSCTALIDMWEGTLPHFQGLGGNLAVVAGRPSSGWRPLRATGGGRTCACSPPPATRSGGITAVTAPTASPFPS